MIQITAPISHGSSGSPVLDENGQVIGVATLIDEEGQWQAEPTAFSFADHCGGAFRSECCGQ